MLRSIRELQAFTIRATDGDIGRVDHFLFDDAQWTLRYVVVDTGEWLPGRRVLVSPRNVAHINVGSHTVELDLTKERIYGSPGIDEAMPVSRQKETEFHDYYDYPYYWTFLGGTGSRAAWSHPAGAVLPPLPGRPARGGQRQAGSDPHLRSSKEIAGYAVQASDGEMGYVRDAIVDDENWMVRYVVIRTGSWLGGHDVMVPAGRVTQIDWEGSRVHFDGTRDEIRNSAHYDPATVLNRPDPALPDARKAAQDQTQ
jgi:hypothetical protein